MSYGNFIHSLGTAVTVVIEDKVKVRIGKPGFQIENMRRFQVVLKKKEVTIQVFQYLLKKLNI